MDRQLKITEVSLSFQVCGKLKTPVDSSVPFVVDRRETNTERVVPVGIDANAVPDWIFNCKPGYLKFTYASELQNVECTFKESSSVLTLHGIKQRNFGAFLDGDTCHLYKIFRILGLSDGCSISGSPRTTYKAALVLDVGAPWDRDIIAEVITNDPEVSQMAAVSEAVSTLSSRSLFSISIVTESKEYARVTLRRDDQMLAGQKVTATISRLSKAEDSVQVADVVESIFATYSKSYSRTQLAKIERKEFSKISGITRLRSELPELFINNYTRECPVLPIMLSQEQAELLEDIKRVIFYPLNSAMGRYYTAPDGYYVGLKKNRLHNRDLFPCLVTCYLHDHMSRKGSETYIYYTGEEVTNKNKSARPVPRSMGYSLLGIDRSTGGSGYDRRRAPSFVRAIETATGEAIESASLPWCPQVVKQEMWNVSDGDIMAKIRCAECGPLAYRYFEELLKVSIHVVVIKNGMFESLVPSHKNGAVHKDSYIWAPPYPQHVVIFETIRKTYGETRFLYDVLVRDNSITVFDSGEPAVLSIVAQKSSESVCPPDTVDAVEQLIDERGKCRMIYTSSGKLQMTLTRPLTVPVMPDPVCFLDLHIHKMNAIKNAMGLPTIDLYKRSTKSILYFPNDASFFYWIDKITPKDTTAGATT